MARTPESKKPAQAGNGNLVEGLLGLVSASVMEVSGRVVLALAPVHLNRTGMFGWVGDALLFPTELPLLGFDDMVNGRLFGFLHGYGFQ